MKKILVTGGSGFLGSSLIQELIKGPKKIVVFDNNFRGSFKKFKYQDNKVTLFKGDIRKSSDISKAIKDCDEVYHLAFINGTKNFYESPELVLDVGINGILNILKIIREKKIKKFLFASSSEVYHKPKKFPGQENEHLVIPNPQNPRFSYSSSKIIGEVLTLNYLRNTKIKHFIFRPHNIFGPQMGFEHVIPEILKKIYLASNKFKKKRCVIKIQGNGSETRSFCFIDDAAKQIIRINKKGKNKEIYNVGQTFEISILKLIKDISKIIGIKIKVKPGKLTRGSVLRRCPDIKKIKKLGKNDNNYYFGLRKTINWYKNFYIKKYR